MGSKADTRIKPPKVMLYFDSWNKGGPGSVVNRLTQSLKARGCHVTWVLAHGSEDILPEQHAADEVITVPLPGDGQWFPDKDELQKAYFKIKPDILITEQFPFVAHDEALHTLVHTAKLSTPKAQVYSVARDVSRTDLSKYELKELVDKITTPYDHVYIRGDEQVVGLENFLGCAPWQFEPLQEKLSYAGYMSSDRKAIPSSQKGKGEVVVSLGGGVFEDIDESMYSLLIERAAELKQSGEVSSPWHFFVSKRYPKEQYDVLIQKAAEVKEATGVDIQIDRNRADYLEYVKNADMVVVRGGMSAVESVAMGKPTLIIPYNVFGKDTEQEIRANGLKNVAGDRVEVVPQYMNGHSVMKMFPVSRSTLTDAIKQLYPMRHVGSVPPNIKVNGHETIADDIMDRYMVKKAGINDNATQGKHVAALREQEQQAAPSRG